MSRREVLAGLVDAWMAEAAASDPKLAAPYDDVVDFLDQRLACMPDYLRAPLAILTQVFDWSALALHGARFSRLGRDARLRHASRWSASRLAPLRDLMTLYRSLSSYALYARLDHA